MKKITVLLIAFLILGFYSVIPPAAADPASVELSQTSPSCGVCQLAESESYAKSAPGKLGRGVVNILFGWTNLFAQPVRKTGGSVMSGIGNGFSYTFIRTVQGVVELGMFWVPPAHGEPLNHCAFGDLGITGR